MSTAETVRSRDVSRCSDLATSWNGGSNLGRKKAIL